MEVVIQPKSQLLEEKNATLPTSSSNIPDIVEEMTREVDGKICCTRYLKGRLLGKGGFAKCFQASLLPCRTQFALKIVSKSTLAKSRARQKLQTEISIHRKMRHQFVVKFERYFEDTENAYMLLELCSNNSMSELLKRRRRVSELETKCYTSQLISSLKYLRGQLVIHRDLKLGNLFLDSKLRVKVGDFGLAARLSHVDEKRRTICGTPNYIAPEVLEGKEGHSFEVDIWSAGVVMYTLLVGTPPFESKDVKSTYKRILNNSFAFPDHIVLSEDVKHLIRLILQSKPENRPSLDTIMNHNFFTGENSFVPDVLPESALYSTPQKQQVFILNSNQNQSQNVNIKESSVPVSVGRQLTYGDENDPNVANRATTTNARVSSHVAKNCDIQLNNLNHSNHDVVKKPYSQSHSTIDIHLNHPLHRHHTNGHSAVPPSSQPPPSVFPVSLFPKPSVGFQILQDHTPSALTCQHSSRANAKEVKESIASTLRMTTDAIRAPMSVTSAATALTTTRSATTSSARISHCDTLSDKPSNTVKLDVIDTTSCSKKDSLPSTIRSTTVFSSALPINATAGMGQSRSNRSPTMWSRSSALQRYANALGQTAGSGGGPSDYHELAKARKRTSSGMASVGQIELELENVHLNNPNVNSIPHNGLVSRQSREGSGSSKELSSKKRIDKTPNSRAKIAKHDTNDRKVSTTRAHNDEVEKKYVSQSQENGSSMKRKSGDEEVVSSNTNTESICPNYVSPTDDIFSKRKSIKTPGTLEAMHEMLNLNYKAIIDGNDVKCDDFEVNTLLPAPYIKKYQSLGGFAATPAQIWVVRYVDFTSKYGLGYLLNNNASGVCFNDSTKIILSPNGEIFQYIERKRVSLSSNGSTFEQTIQTHSIHHYPVELQKKVTLLCHFRNYLTEQVKSDAEADYGEEGCHGSEMDENLNRRIPIDSNAAKAASSKLKFGISSAIYNPQIHDIVDQEHETKLIASQDVVDKEYDNMDETIPEMAYLKKWIRTKHAILFRLSNRSVQVVFFDRSEILLSAEAKMITYVNKQGARADLSLHGVIQTGRKDVAKRLKYTKDIMHRLITIQHA